LFKVNSPNRVPLDLQHRNSGKAVPAVICIASFAIRSRNVSRSRWSGAQAGSQGIRKSALWSLRVFQASKSVDLGGRRTNLRVQMRGFSVSSVMNKQTGYGTRWFGSERSRFAKLQATAGKPCGLRQNVMGRSRTGQDGAGLDGRGMICPIYMVSPALFET